MSPYIKAQINAYLKEYLEKLLGVEIKNDRTKFSCPVCKMPEKAQLYPNNDSKFNCYNPECTFKKGDLFDLIKATKNIKFKDEDVAEYLKRKFNIVINDDVDDLLKLYDKNKFTLFPLQQGEDLPEKNKRPVPGFMWLEKLYTDPKIWKEWVDRGYGLALRLGDVSYVAIDIDDDKTYKKMKDKLGEDTLIQKTKRGCYDKETEVLTDQGWKYFKDLDKTEKIAQWNNSNIEYVVPSHYFKYKYDGEMYHIKNKSIDMLVTPNHNMYVCSSTWIRNNPTFKTMEKIYQYAPSTAHIVPADFKWNGKYVQFFTLPKLNHKLGIPKMHMTDWVAFLGWFLSEGSCYYNEDKKRYKVTIWQKKPKEVLKIYRLLKKLPFHSKYFHVKRGNGEINTGFDIYNKQLASYLKQFGKCDEKFIPREILNLTTHQLKCIYEALMLGDGDKDGRYYTTSKQLADDVQELITKIGHRSNIKSRNRGVGRKKCYHVKIYSNKNSCFRKSDIQKTLYNDYVYCVEVPSNLLIVRRNGKMLVCGNSHWLFSYEEWMKDINHINFRPKGYDMEIRANNAYIAIAPSCCDGEVRKWNNKKICKMSKELKEFILGLIDKDTKNVEEEIQESINKNELGLTNGLTGLDGQCNDVFIKLGGIFRKKMTVDVTKYALHYVNQLLEHPMDKNTMKGMGYQLEKYQTYDKKELSNEVIKRLETIKEATAYQIASSLKKEVKDIEDVLKYLEDENKVVALAGRKFKMLEDVEWVTDKSDMGVPIDFRMPYFHDYARFNVGGMIIIGSATGKGKSHIAGNFIKQLWKQKRVTHLINTESDSGIGRITNHLKIPDEAYLVPKKAVNHPTDIELKDNAVTVIDWLKMKDGDFTKTDNTFEHFSNQLKIHKGFMIIFTQIRTSDSKFFAPDQIANYGALVVKYLWGNDGIDGENTHFLTTKIRDSKSGNQYLTIPTFFNQGTKILEIRK